MSRRRYLSTRISLDTVVNDLAVQSDFAALLYTWMIAHAEDSASISASGPDELMLAVVPGRRDKAPADVEDALLLMDALGLVSWDRDAGAVYFDSASFYHYQSMIREERRVDNSSHFSRIPAKPGSAKRRQTPPNAASSAKERRMPQVAPNDASFSLSSSSRKPLARRGGRAAPLTLYTEDFTAWLKVYGNGRDKADAEPLYGYWRDQGATAEELLVAAKNYRASCEGENVTMKYAKTFLAKDPCRWREWVKPETLAPRDQPSPIEIQHEEVICPACGEEVSAKERAESAIWTPSGLVHMVCARNAHTPLGVAEAELRREREPKIAGEIVAGIVKSLPEGES